MRILSLFFVLFPSVVLADFGVEFSYRSIPVMYQPQDGYYWEQYGENKNNYQTQKLDSVMFSVYFGDSLRGRDTNKKNKNEKKKFGWLNINRGAGYTLSFNLMMASIKRQVDIRSYDITIGKRLVVIPHLFHVYADVGPSISHEKWMKGGYNFINKYIGMTASMGVQLQVLKGVKFYTEAEFRKYGPSYGWSESNGNVNFQNKLPLVDKEYDDYYNDFVDNDYHNGREIRKELIDESIRFGVRFTF